MMRMPLAGFAVVAFAFVAICRAATACDSPTLQETPAGLVDKVVAAGPGLEATTEPGGSSGFAVYPLTSYAVLCRDGSFLRISEAGRGAIARFGYVPANRVFHWPTMEALRLPATPLNEPQPAVEAWTDFGKFEQFLATGDRAAFPPDFRETADAVLKRAPLMRPYPVLALEQYQPAGAARPIGYYRILVPSDQAATPSIREAFLPAEGSSLEPRILIDADNLNRLIKAATIVGILGTAETRAANMLAALEVRAGTGDEISADAPVAEIVKRSKAMIFRPRSLDVPVPIAPSAAPEAAWTLHAQSAADALEAFWQRERENLQRDPAVWMPASLLP